MIESPSRARARVLVEGRVQGVCFRLETRAEALRLGVAGWVRNLADGRVELEAEGELDRVQALIAWCHRGPPAAHVRAVAVEWCEPRGDEGAFGIRH